MKKNLLLFLFIINILYANQNILISFDKEQVIKIADFNKHYQTEDGLYIDLGLRYKQLTIFLIPIWNYDETWCGFLENSTYYLNLNHNTLLNAASTINIQIPNYPKKPFWDAIGGKILFSTILLFLFFNVFKTKKNKLISTPLFFTLLFLGYIESFFVFIYGILLYDSKTIWFSFTLLLIGLFIKWKIYRYIKSYKLSIESIPSKLYYALLLSIILGIFIHLFWIVSFTIIFFLFVRTIKIINTLNNYGIHTMNIHEIRNSEYGLIVSLLAKIAKSDGYIDEYEAKVIKNIFLEMSQFYKSPKETRKIFKEIFNYEKNNIYDFPIKATIYFELTSKEYKKRIRLIEILLSVACANGNLTEIELNMIETISDILRIKHNKRDKLINEYHNINSYNSNNLLLSQAYKVLKVSKNDTMKNIKNKYKELARIYHPDLTTEDIHNSTKKLQEINHAYAVIKHHRKKDMS